MPVAFNTIFSDMRLADIDVTALPDRDAYRLTNINSGAYWEITGTQFRDGIFASYGAHLSILKEEYKSPPLSKHHRTLPEWF